MVYLWNKYKHKFSCFLFLLFHKDVIYKFDIEIYMYSYNHLRNIKICSPLALLADAVKDLFVSCIDLLIFLSVTNPILLAIFSISNVAAEFNEQFDSHIRAIVFGSNNLL